MFQTLSQVIRTTKVKSTKLKIVQLRRGRCPLKRGTTGNREKASPPLPHQIHYRIMLIQLHVWLFLLVLGHNNLSCRNNSLGPRPFVSVGVTCAGTSPTSKENACLLSEADQGETTRQKAKQSLRHLSLWKIFLQAYDKDISILPEILREKIHNIPELLSESKASFTVKDYYRSYKKWDDWLKKNGVVIEQGSSREPLIVSFYLASLIQEVVSVSVLTLAVYGIRWAYSLDYIIQLIRS